MLLPVEAIPMSKRNLRGEPNDRFRHSREGRSRGHGAPNSDFHISISTPKYPNRKDIDLQKKVKFTALDRHSPKTCRLEASCIMSERENATTYADTDPKTSEYAFFKKLKKDAGLRFRSHSLQKDACLSKKAESSDYRRERIDDVRVGSKGFNSSRIIKGVSNVKADSFLSPSGGPLNKSDQYSISSMRKSSQGCSDTFKPQGDQYVLGEIFSRKRQKLCQCVADALFLDMEKLCLKGPDIVSMLLSRLFPTSIEENKYEDPKPGKLVSATRYDFLDSRESDVQFKEHHHMPKRKLLELESSSCFNYHLLSPMVLRPVERITPRADFPCYHSHKFQPPCSVTEPECEFGGTTSFSAKSDITLGFLFNEQEQEQETFTLNHFKELGKLRKEPSHLLLDKDFDCTTDDINLPVTCKDAKSDMIPALLTLGNGEEQMLTNILGEYHLSPSALLLDKPHDFDSMLDSGLLRYQEFRFGKNVYEDNTDMDRNYNHTALSLSHNKDYFKLSEDCKTDTSCVQDSMHLSPYKHWIRRTVSNNYHHHPAIEAWLSSSIDYISGRRCLSLTSSHSNYRSSNSGTSQLPQRESMCSLFQNDDNYEPEMDAGNHGKCLINFGNT